MRVRTGLEVFLEPGTDRAGLREGASVALLAHAASVDAGLRHVADRLVADAGLRVERLFAPEHGLRGEAQDMESVEDAVDRRTGVEVRSLYGATESSLRPSTEDLDGIDAVVCDLQDVGARFYTFVYTLSFVMEAAAARGLPVVVLDRPNPIGGVRLEGPVLRAGSASFVGLHPLPVRHGMTIGELARLFNEIHGIGCELRVVPMAGWRRRMYFDDTGLPWVPPSPNMPTLETAVVYSGGCLVEGTNLSEGRGTTRPFETVGAPWIDGGAWADRLRCAGLEGVGFREIGFRPMFQKHAGTACEGVFVHVLDRERFRPFATYLVAIAEARRLAPDRFRWRAETYEFVRDRLAIDLLLGRDDLRPMVEHGASLADLEAAWAADLESFDRQRRSFLIYPD